MTVGARLALKVDATDRTGDVAVSRNLMLKQSIAIIKSEVTLRTIFVISLPMAFKIAFFDEAAVAALDAANELVLASRNVLPWLWSWCLCWRNILV